MSCFLGRNSIPLTHTGAVWYFCDSIIVYYLSKGIIRAMRLLCITADAGYVYKTWDKMR